MDKAGGPFSERQNRETQEGPAAVSGGPTLSPVVPVHPPNQWDELLGK